LPTLALIVAGLLVAYGRINPLGLGINQTIVNSLLDGPDNTGLRWGWASQAIDRWTVEHYSAALGDIDWDASGDSARPIDGEGHFLIKRPRIRARLGGQLIHLRAREAEAHFIPGKELRMELRKEFRIDGAVTVVAPAALLRIPAVPKPGPPPLEKSRDLTEEAGRYDFPVEQVTMRVEPPLRLSLDMAKLTAVSRPKQALPKLEIESAGRLTISGRDRLVLEGPLSMELPSGLSTSLSKKRKPSAQDQAVRESFAGALVLKAGRLELESLEFWGKELAPGVLGVHLSRGVALHRKSDGRRMFAADELDLVLGRRDPARNATEMLGGIAGVAPAVVEDAQSLSLISASAKGKVFATLLYTPRLPNKEKKEESRKRVKKQRAMAPRWLEIRGESLDWDELAGLGGAAGAPLDLRQADGLAWLKVGEVAAASKPSGGWSVKLSGGLQGSRKLKGVKGLEELLIQGNSADLRLLSETPGKDEGRESEELRVEEAELRGSPARLERRLGSELVWLEAERLAFLGAQKRLEARGAIRGKSLSKAKGARLASETGLAGSAFDLSFDQDPSRPRKKGAPAPLPTEFELKGSPAELTIKRPEELPMRAEAAQIDWSKSSEALSLRGGSGLAAFERERSDLKDAKGRSDRLEASLIRIETNKGRALASGLVKAFFWSDSGLSAGGARQGAKQFHNSGDEAAAERWSVSGGRLELRTTPLKLELARLGQKKRKQAKAEFSSKGRSLELLAAQLWPRDGQRLLFRSSAGAQVDADEMRWDALQGRLLLLPKPGTRILASDGQGSRLSAARLLIQRPPLPGAKGLDSGPELVLDLTGDVRLRAQDLFQILPDAAKKSKPEEPRRRAKKSKKPAKITRLALHLKAQSCRIRLIEGADASRPAFELVELIAGGDPLAPVGDRRRRVRIDADVIRRPTDDHVVDDGLALEHLRV